MNFRVLSLSLVVLFVVQLGAPLRVPAATANAPAPTVMLDVDASDAVRKILHVHERLAVSPGPVKLVYPKWIPGEHAPSGPVVNVSGFAMRAGAATIPWRRDLDDPFAIHVDVPAGVSSLDVTYDYFGVPVGDYSDARFSTGNMLAINWNKVLLTPDVADYRTITVAATLRLPSSDWQYGTALDTTAHAGADLTFAPVTMEMLVDSPLDAGTVARRWPLGSIDGAPVELAAFADSADQLEASDATIQKFRNLVGEMGALYHARHFNHYTFLLTVSDTMAENGVEHHQSSDDGTKGKFLTEADDLMVDADLLPHEFNHSWDGKYRRPADLATPNLQVPMRDDLLWVYEGMTQYYGDVQSARSGLRTNEEWRDELALRYAQLDRATGRLTRPLRDTADDASILYSAPNGFSSARRGVDFYDEGELMWLEADQIIRRLSHGTKSLDDVARSFFGGRSTGPTVVTYTRADVVAAFAAVEPYDWQTFFTQRVDAIAPHPPDPFTPGGWKLVYLPTRSSFEKTLEDVTDRFDARWSIGIEGMDDGTISDVIDGSPAARAGVAPGAKIVAFDGHEAHDGMQRKLDGALATAQRGSVPLHLLVLSGGMYRDIAIPYRDGPRYPRLEPLPGAPDSLDRAALPRR